MIITLLTLITDPIRLSSIRHVYNQLIKLPTSSSVFYGGMPISMMAESMVHVTQQYEDGEFAYNVTPKLDGLRMLMMMHPSTGLVFIDRSLMFYEPVIRGPRMVPISSIYLFDGELYQTVFFIFDVLLADGNLIANYIFEHRIQWLLRATMDPKHDFHKKVRIPLFKQTSLTLTHKQYFKLNDFANSTNVYHDICRVFVQYYTMIKFKINFDGLIFTPRFTKYVVADNWKFPFNILYKWKPTHDETIDFVIPDISTRVVHVMSRDGSRLTPFRIQNIPAVLCSQAVRTNTVYECTWDRDHHCFNVLRERADKLKPNHINTALSIFKLLENPVDINNLMIYVNDRSRELRQVLTLSPDWQLRRMLLNCKLPTFMNDMSLLHRFQRQRLPTLEFEVRIGRRVHNRFDSRVSYSHFQWLKKTLDTMSVPCVYYATVDVFNDTTRTTYYNVQTVSMFRQPLTIRRSVCKQRLDVMDLNYESIYGYSIRLSVQSELPVTTHVPHNHPVYRKKKRYSYNVNKYFILDLTEYTTPQETGYQIELELKKEVPLSIPMLNTTVRFIMNALYGKSELI
jgi:hypothetical protein